jgi:cytochrome c-type biogenesis protein
METTNARIRRGFSRRTLALGIGTLAALLALALLVPAPGETTLQPSLDDSSAATFLVLTLPAYLAGALSLLSPCCLPILPAYFAFSFGAQRQRIVAMSVAFFLGLATTLVVLGASLTALSALIFPFRELLARGGGLIIIGFGVMSVLGKGFSGLQVTERPATTLLGTYLYGLTFAFGWTACVGPILGAILTALATTGVSVLAGAALAFIYALGLATPLTLLAVGVHRIGPKARLGTILRGRGFSVRVGSMQFHMHTTSLISGLLLITVGVMLATGELVWLSQRLASGWAANLVLNIDRWLAHIFGLGW